MGSVIVQSSRGWISVFSADSVLSCAIHFALVQLCGTLNLNFHKFFYMHLQMCIRIYLPWCIFVLRMCECT